MHMHMHMHMCMYLEARLVVRCCPRSLPVTRTAICVGMRCNSH